jgi:hypothetical protein
MSYFVGQNVRFYDKDISGKKFMLVGQVVDLIEGANNYKKYKIISEGVHYFRSPDEIEGGDFVEESVQD